MVDNRFNRQRFTPPCNSCANMKNARERLRAVEFAIVDTALYLDVYPDCRGALEHYHKLMKEREALAAMVNKTYGPLTIGDVQSDDKWTWVRGPWPWEPDAN